MSHSKTTAIGRLTRDPDFKKITIKGEETSVVNFTIAVDENFGESTDFYDVVAWRAQADNIAKYLNKGRLVFVEGRLKIRQFNKDIGGESVTMKAPEIRADNVQFLDRAPEGNNSQTNTEQNTQRAAVQGEMPF